MVESAFQSDNSNLLIYSRIQNLRLIEIDQGFTTAQNACSLNFSTKQKSDLVEEKKKTLDAYCTQYEIHKHCYHEILIGMKRLIPRKKGSNILGLISLSQIRKFLRCDSPQIANPHIFMINPQIFTKCCTPLCQNNPKSRLFKRFLLSTNLN
jgi:hypothetical protein